MSKESEEEVRRKHYIEKNILSHKDDTWEERAQKYVENQNTVGLMSDPLLWSSEDYIVWLCKQSSEAKKQAIENCKNERLLKKLMEI